MSAGRQVPRVAARGFVLVGVVMMVIALTIIGLSLYSLSGYEVQFFGRSLADRQALYSASGGLELTKSLLATPFGTPPAYELANASRAIGRKDVVSALAWQDDPADSSGPIVWSKPIHVRVGVQVNGVTRTMQGTYIGANQRNPYHCVFATPGAITTQVEGNNRPLLLQGTVWQPFASSQDTAWTPALDWRSQVSFVLDEPPPLPLAAQYFAEHPQIGCDSPVKQMPDTKDSTNFVLTLDASGGPGGVRYFRAYTDSNTASTGNLPLQDVYSQRIVHVRVAGTAVWVIPNGALFEGEFRIERLGTGTATLVMVVGPNGRWPGAQQVGPWFQKGIKIEPPGSSNVSVFIVSQATARIEDVITTEDIFARAVSVFAGRIEFQGPHFVGGVHHNMNLYYKDSMENLANTLSSSGVLPSYSGQTSGRFALVPGSWTTSPGLP